MPNETRCTCDDLVNNGDHYCPIHGTFAAPASGEAAPSGEPPAFSREAVMAHAEDFPSEPASPVQEGPQVCGEVVAHLIAGASWFPCALPKGHEGGHRAAGNCFTHGAYLGEPSAVPQCPKWPECTKGITLAASPAKAAPPKCLCDCHDDSGTDVCCSDCNPGIFAPSAPEADLHRQIAIAKQNGAKWIQVAVADIEPLLAAPEPSGEQPPQWVNDAVRKLGEEYEHSEGTWDESRFKQIIWAAYRDDQSEVVADWMLKMGYVTSKWQRDQLIEPLRAALRSHRQQTALSVGEPEENLYVYGSDEAIKVCQNKLFGSHRQAAARNPDAHLGAVRE